MKIIYGFSPLFFLFVSCMSSESKEPTARLSDCDCKEIAYRVMMSQQSIDDLDNMKTCIIEGEKKNSKVAHANEVGDIAEAFLGFSELCDQHVTENNLTNQAASPPPLPDSSRMKLESHQSSLPSEYLGDYHGIQAGYFLKNQDGEHMVINGQKVPIPSSDFKFELKENNVVNLQQTNLEDNSRYSYNGTYQIMNESPDNLVVKCSLSSDNGSHPAYTLTIKKSGKTGNCTGQNEPEFVITKINQPATLDSEIVTNQINNVNEQTAINKQADSERQEHNTIAESGYPTGYYTVIASESNKVYFHNLPDTSTRRKAYIDSQIDLYVEEVRNGFGYVEFTNDSGQRSIGWLKMDDLVLKP